MVLCLRPILNFLIKATYQLCVSVVFSAKVVKICRSVIHSVIKVKSTHYSSKKTFSLKCQENYTANDQIIKEN